MHYTMHNALPTNPGQMEAHPKLFLKCLKLGPSPLPAHFKLSITLRKPHCTIPSHISNCLIPPILLYKLFSSPPRITLKWNSS